MRITILSRQLGVLLASLFVLLVTGCAAPRTMTADGLKPSALPVFTTHPSTISVHTLGGREKSPLGMPQITDEQLTAAVSDALLRSKLFAGVVPVDGDYQLNLFIVKVSQPFVGKEMQVKVEIGWTLRQKGLPKILWQESILTEDTATPAEEGFGPNRVLLATQRATQKNLAVGIERLSRLKL